MVQARLNQLVVRDSGRPRRLWQAGVVGRVWKDAWERIDLHQVRCARGVQPDVDARPVPAAQDPICTENDRLDPLAEGFRDSRGAFEDLQRLFRTVPDPLGLE